tara:strand:+ start:1136 stop:2512 length:1377 start_codon:yes stop_codon:yes gene_type:complete
MNWKVYENVPNRKKSEREDRENRKRKAGDAELDEELEDERRHVTQDYKTLAKRLRHEKPSYIALTEHLAQKIAKDILYHETIMEQFTQQPAYRFIMNVASFTNDDVSKFWSDHIKTNKPTQYVIGDDTRDTAIAVARERADQDVHQWCKLIKIPEAPEAPDAPRTPGTPLRSDATLISADTVSPSTNTSVIRASTTSRDYARATNAIQSIWDGQDSNEIEFENIKTEKQFLRWIRTKYKKYLQDPEEQKAFKNRIAHSDGKGGGDGKTWYYDFRELRFTEPPDRVSEYPKNCHEDPCGFEYIKPLQPYYKQRFDYHIHAYLTNHYEEKMAYETQKWYNSSPETNRKIFFAPIIYGHMNEVTYALTHRYEKFKRCNPEDFYYSKDAVLFAKCVALAIRGSQVLSGKKYGLDKSFMRINLEKRRAMHAWKHIKRPPPVRVTTVAHFQNLQQIYNNSKKND